MSSLEARDKPWAIVLETLALKKTRTKVFLLEEFEDVLANEGADDNYQFNVPQLRAKYKWLKKEWRKINTKIRTGSGLGAKDTKVPSWYELLEPLFSVSVDDMLSISSKASDLLASDQDSGDESSTDEERESVASGHSNSQSVDSPGLRKGSLTQVPRVVDGGSEDKGVDDDNKCAQPKKKVRKDTVVKVASKTKKQPKTQTAAMWQMVQSIERCSTKQEKNSDERLEALLEAERIRDELFLNFQREQAEANRRHELQIAQLLMSGSASGHPPIPCFNKWFWNLSTCIRATTTKLV